VLHLEYNLPRPNAIQHDSIDDADQVLIQTKYAGIQYPDYLQAMGLYQIKPQLPYIPGMDISGIVIDKGCNVTDVKIGDRVYANTALCTNGNNGGGIGGLSEYIRVSSNAVFPLPTQLHNQLSSVANIGRNYCASYHSLKVIGNVTNSDLILVTGASGGVGMATIELAKAMGCKVIAGVSSLNKAGNAPLSVGADIVLPYGHDATSHAAFKANVKAASTTLGHPQGVSLIVDVVHGDLFTNALVSCIQPLGTICLVGFAGGQRPIKPGLLLIKEAMVVGSLWGRWARENPVAFRVNMNEILTYMADGRITARVDNIFMLEEYIKAFELYERNEGRGNTVISITDANNEDDGSHRSKL
jgi:NADPH:quinone reductase-like Zn-dependent oxidoreductase